MRVPFHPTVPGLHEAIHELCAAFTAETRAYRSLPYDNAIAEAANDRANEAIAAVTAFDKEAVLEDMDKTGDLAFVQALALTQQRWLICEGNYQSKNAHPVCLLVDLVLASSGEPFSEVPMLWHIDGKDRDERPSDAEFQAGWGDD